MKLLKLITLGVAIWSCTLIWPEMNLALAVLWGLGVGLGAGLGFILLGWTRPLEGATALEVSRSTRPASLLLSSTAATQPMFPLQRSQD